MKNLNLKIKLKRGKLTAITIIYAFFFFLLVFLLSDFFIENVLSNTVVVFTIKEYRIWAIYILSVYLVFQIVKIHVSKLIRADEILKQTEDSYQILVENLKEDYFFYRHEKDIVFQNISQSIENILGYTPKDFKENYQKYNAEKLVGGYIQRHEVLYDSALKMPPFEVEVIDIKNEKRILEVKEIPIIGENNEIIAVEGLAHDITDYKRFEIELKEKDNKFHTLFESANDAILILKGDKIVDCNKKSLEMFDCSVEQIIMQTLYSYKFSSPIQSDEKSAKEKGRQKLIEALHGEPQFFEWTHSKINGEKFETEVSLSRFLFNDEYYILAIIRDITERKKSELSLIKREEHYRDLYETSIVGLYRTRISDGKIIYCNQVALDNLGYKTLKEATDDNCKVNSLYSKERRGEMLKLLNEHGYVQDFEIHQKFSNGRENYISISSKIFPEKGYIEGTVFDITKRKIAKEEILEKEKKLKDILDNSRAILYKLNASDGTYSYMSPSCYSILGYYPEEMLKMDINEQKTLLHPDDLGRANNIIAKLISSVPKNRSFYTTEYRLKHKKGGYRWLSDSYNVVKNEENKTIFVIGNIIDITEEQEAQIALKESELRFRNMADIIKNGVTINENGKNVYVNDRLIEITGYSEEELLLFSEFQIAAPEEKKRLQKIILNLQKSNENIEEIEFWIIRKDGKQKCILNRYAYNYVDDEKIVKYIITSDITDRKLMENTLRENEEKFKELANALPQTIVETNVAGLITYLNKSGLNLLGYTEKDIENGINIFDIIVAEDLENAKINFGKLIIEEKQKQLEYSAKKKNGKIIPVLLYPNLIYKDDEVIGIRGIIIDTTNQRRIQEELNVAKGAIEAANKAKSIFLTNLTHEIRTPMNSIYGMTELIKKTALSDKQYDFLKVITESSENLLSILNDILIIPKIESGNISFDKKVFKIQDVLTSVAGLVSYQAELKKIKIIETQKFYDDLVVISDSSRLNQILINLVEYSIKNTNEGQIEIKIDALEENNDNVTLEFSVLDTSKGLPENIIKSLKEDFEKTHLDVYSEYGSYGLGLIIANKLVSLLGSELNIESSEKGVDASFKLKLRKSNISDLDKSGDISEENQSLKNIKILLVEDELFNQLVIKSMIEKWDCEIDTVYNGKDALTKLKGNLYDIVLMDIVMPEMNGIQTTKLIRESLKEPVSKTPIIAITANVDTDDHKLFLKSGINYSISKPFKSNDLFHVLVKGLGIKDKKEILEIDVLTEPKIDEVVDKNQLYDLRIIKNISKNNKVLIIKMIKVFIDKTKIELKDLDRNLVKKDWKSISNIAHKMKPASSYMGIKNIEKKISNIYIYSKEEKHLDKIPVLINELRIILEKVLDSMSKDIINYEKEI